MTPYTDTYEVKVGLPPGAVVHLGARHDFKSRVSVIKYNQGQFSETVMSPEDIGIPKMDNTVVTWLNIVGVHDTMLLESLGKHMSIHSLILADIANTRHRPKLEIAQNYLFIVLKALRCKKRTEKVAEEQVSMLLGEGFVLTFLESDDTLFDPIRERLRSSVGRIRSSGADYLAYTLLDVIVDNYFVVLERRGELIEKLEDEILDTPKRSTLSQIHALKRDMVIIRRSVWPLREILNSLERGDSKHFNESTLLYLRDVYDHVVQLMDNIETSRDMLAGMMDIYLSSNSNRMNAVMKVLTIIATIFMPLTFIAGVYGMNFKYMPELQWRYGYMAAWVLMLGVVLSMVLYFRRKKWL
jgi:magnesium transporter